VNNISVTTSGLLTGSRNLKCTSDTWILSAQRGQRIELIVRDYTSRGVDTSSTDDHDNPHSSSSSSAAAAADDDDAVVSDENSRSAIVMTVT